MKNIDDDTLDASVASSDAAIGEAVRDDRKKRFKGHYDASENLYWRDDDVPDKKVKKRWKNFDKDNAENPKKQNIGWEREALAAHDKDQWNTVAGLATWLREQYKKLKVTDPNFSFTQNIVRCGFRGMKIIVPS